MKVTFFSNFLNHHQLPLSLEMINKGIDYTFVATEPVPEERIKLGYENMNDMYDFVLKTYESNDNYQKAMKLAEISDMVIIGSAPNEFLKKRLELNKITFRYSERIFKKGKWKLLIPRMRRNLYKEYVRDSNKRIYLLAASAYATKDFNLIGAYKNKSYKWGYFPETTKHDIDKLIQRKQNNTVINILWVGRFIKWKHPEKAIKLAKFLKKKNYKFKITMIGKGPLHSQTIKLRNRYNLENEVNIMESMPNEKVIEYMKNSNIFIFTSDKQEGWGAVLNEAMNSGCAIVANEEIGSVPYLIKNGENGFCYRKNKTKELCEKICILIEDNNLRENFGKNAYSTLQNVWNANNATNRLLKLYTAIENGEKTEFTDGPCSKA